jgi:hypothetical protein
MACGRIRGIKYHALRILCTVNQPRCTSSVGVAVATRFKISASSIGIAFLNLVSFGDLDELNHCLDFVGDFPGSYCEDPSF